MALTTNLLHYWDLTDDGVWADSVGDWDLTETGTVTTAGTQPKGSGSCCDQDTGDYLSRTDVAWDGGGSARSISIWARADTINSTGNWAYSHRGGTGPELLHNLAFWKGSPDTIIYSTGDGTDFVSLFSTTTASTATWYHIVGTTNGTNSHKLYINGTNEATDTTAFADATPSGALEFTIGTSGWDHHAVREHEGQLFACGVWDRELSAAEVTSLYSSGNGLTYAQLAGETAALAPLAATFAVVAQTAVADTFDAALSPLTVTFTIVATTATATEIAANVTALATTFGIVEPTATVQVNAAVSALTATWTIPATTPTSLIEVSSSSSPLAAALSIPSVTALKDAFDAGITPLAVSWTIPATTPTSLIEVSASLAALAANLSIATVTAEYGYEAVVAPLVVQWTMPSVTAQASNILALERGTRGVSRGILTGAV